jgi:membrane protein
MIKHKTADRFKPIKRFVRQVAQRFIHDRCQRVAGALSFTTLLAIVPLTAVTVSVLSMFPVFGAWMSVIQEFIYINFVPAAGDVVEKYLTQFAAKAGRLTAVGIAFLVLTSIMLMATIEQAFNDIWRVRNTRKLHYRILSYWALLTLGPILVAASLVLTTNLFTSLPFTAKPDATLNNQVLELLLPWVLEFGGVVLLYFVVPNVSVPWRHAVVGAGFTVVLLEVAKALFAGAMKYFVLTYKIVYGTVAALPIFLIWIYISWVVILLGAIVTATLGDEGLWLGSPRKKRRAG